MLAGCSAATGGDASPEPTTTIGATGDTVSGPTESERPSGESGVGDSVAGSSGGSSGRSSGGADTAPVGVDWVVAEVVDGDTVVVVGLDGEQRVRLVGINTPETYLDELGGPECFGPEAGEALRGLAEGIGVALVRDVSDTDRYGRLLRYVETEDGVDLGAEMVRLGFARSVRYEPDVARSDRYDDLQDAAESAGRGMWAPDACGSTVMGEVRVGIDVQVDAPGDDNTNLNGEWVRFTNDGVGPLDLTGWIVADESSSHRYRFDELVLGVGASVTLYTGCGVDGSTERFWCNQDSAVWNNSGDTVFLQDPDGRLVARFGYGD